jgi:hypothetical protein
MKLVISIALFANKSLSVIQWVAVSGIPMSVCVIVQGFLAILLSIIIYAAGPVQVNVLLVQPQRRVELIKSVAMMYVMSMACVKKIAHTVSGSMRIRTHGDFYSFLFFHLIRFIFRTSVEPSLISDALEYLSKNPHVALGLGLGLGIPLLLCIILGCICYCCECAVRKVCQAIFCWPCILCCPDNGPATVLYSEWK